MVTVLCLFDGLRRGLVVDRARRLRRQLLYVEDSRSAEVSCACWEAVGGDGSRSMEWTPAVVVLHGEFRAEIDLTITCPLSVRSLSAHGTASALPGGSAREDLGLPLVPC